MATTNTAPVGTRFGYLTVLSEGTPHYSLRSASRGRKSGYRATRTWVVECDCGEVVTVLATNVRAGRTVTCGKHGHGRTKPPHIPISYVSAHLRAKRAKGRASDHTCVCGQRAEHWAYNNRCPEEVEGWANTEQRVMRWCEHVEHYTPMCAKCHKNFDIAEKKARNDQV